VAVLAGTQSLLTRLQAVKARELKRYTQLRNQLLSENPDQVEKLASLWNEQRLRVDLLDRLIFYTDSHYKTGDERAFLQSAALKLAERDLVESPQKGREIWPFLRNFAKVIVETKDSDLTGVALLESLMEYSTLANPKDLQGFLRSRDYTNGVRYETPKGVDVSEIESIDTQPTAPVAAKKLAAPQLKQVGAIEKPKATESFQ